MADGILNPIEQLEADFDFDVYTKQEVDALLDEKADKSDTYTKTETDALLNDKADADAVYTKTETDTLLSAKADKSTTYTKTETDTLLNGKADADSVYTKTEINTKIPNTVGSATKPTYVNGGVITECTYELNKTVPANAVFTDTTYSAGNGLNLSGTSFSAKAGVNVSVDGNGINVNGNGAVASADSGLVSGGTAYTELRPTLDGTWVKNAQTTAINLQKLEGGIEYLYAILSKQYDQLKKYINGNYYDYDTDANSKYTKSVPQGAMPYASLDSIGGKTLVWNQLAPDGYSKTGAGTTALNVGTSIVKGHKYYISRTLATADNSEVYFYVRQNGTGYYMRITGTATAMIETAPESGTSNGTTLNVDGNAWIYQAATANTVTNLMLVDLTLMYGSGNEPSTIAEFQQMFPADYYAFNQGSLLSAGVTEVVSVGKNLWNSANLLSNAKYTINADGSVTISASNYSVNTATTLKTICPHIQAGKTYTLQGFGASSSAQLIYLLNGAGSWAFGTSKTLTENDLNATVLIYGAQSSASDYAQTHTIFFDLVEGQTAPTSHTPYKAPISYPIPADIQALEGYGWSAGTVYNYVDFERKVFVKRVASVDLGTLSWTYSYNRFSADVPNMNTSTTTRLDGLTCIYPIDTNSYIDENMSDKTCKRYAGKVLIKDSAYTTTSAFTSAMSGVYLYYELATPIEVDVSAYLTDDNLISVEAGGSLTFPNQHGDDYRIDVPSAETYMVDLQASLGE